MNIKKQKVLQELFPTFFNNSNTVNPWNPLKCFNPIEGFGIECGDGWFDLICDLSSKIETYNNSIVPKYFIHKVWLSFIEKLLKRFPVRGYRFIFKFNLNNSFLVPRKPVHAVQVKEKYGRLEIYVDNYLELIDAWIEKACEKSLTVCEICGKPGKLRVVNGWYFTACDSHQKR